MPNILRYIPGYRRVTEALRQHYAAQPQRDAPSAPYLPNPNPFLEFAPPGHFYSPLPDAAYIERHKDRLFDNTTQSVAGIELHVEQQLALAKRFAAYYGELPFKDERSPGLRYYFHNDWFSYGDAIVLYSMLRHYRPRRIIEVGSGFSSAVMLDTNDLFLDKGLALTFIEPNPERLFALLSDEDKNTCEIIVREVQDVPVERFNALRADDILFIDSSHVAKIGSDVVHLLTNVLPILNKGVIVHIHDVFWPFEYPQLWLSQGRAWNELYLVKAFLQFNTHFKILFFNSYLGVHHVDALGKLLPLFPWSPGGSIWLEKAA